VCTLAERRAKLRDRRPAVVGGEATRFGALHGATPANKPNVAMSLNRTTQFRFPEVLHKGARRNGGRHADQQGADARSWTCSQCDLACNPASDVQVLWFRKLCGVPVCRAQF
jgi:hypothetical protein